MPDDHDASEDRAELERHHRDFAKVSDICDKALSGALDPIDALKQIRNIVG